MKIGLKVFSHYLPGKPLGNQQLIDRHKLRMKAEWIEDYLGIKSRHWVSDEAASELAIKAVEALNIPSDVKASLWLSTVSPDFFSPSTSSIVKARLRWGHDLPALDINSACTGLLSAIKIAHDSLICSEVNDAVVVSTETRSKFLDMNDRKTVFLFGDGACGLWLTKNAAPWSIDWISTWTHAAEYADIFVKTGGSKFPVGAPGSDPRPVITILDGENLTKEASVDLPKLILEKLEMQKVKLPDFDYFIIHPGNKQIYQNLLAALSIPKDKSFTSLETTGNVGSATVGISLSMSHQLNLLPTKGKVLVITIGAGHHLGMMSLNRN